MKEKNKIFSAHMAESHNYHVRLFYVLHDHLMTCRGEAGFLFDILFVNMK